MSSDPKSRLFEQLARVGTAFASAGRLQLLELLAQGERSVDVLAAMSGLSVANCSKHLQMLRQAGLVTARKDGLRVFYAVAGDDVIALYAALQRVAENRVAEVERLLRTWLAHRDELEPVAPAELIDRAKLGLVTVLDVRPAEEYAAGHLPGAINIPVDQLESRLAKLPRRREIVAYCRGPYCLMSFEAVATLRKRGLKARRLENGFPEWRAAGLPVER
ncbi:MAG: ArsR family transcriptional regulator [Betaproteobacteria bacterium RIFCSPLOWO2_02_67_12]|nr:MAG: ArsR family transcriptional regulator [Betaproteobacteria bacterium RIFCSPLOWO2_02_67_12]OGA30795.1 MAG: ArsR family transcriptional regulator [Betaproteobacteria bacterium RIFCSPLOWO2_02_FULL_68_150]OGA69967.1 MAG: ArsR family transcriptional regulator [Betaproteobacteria bacterium RIFCSPLOWO2_12_FULL_67_28]